MTPRPDMIDLVGRAAERLDLNNQQFHADRAPAAPSAEKPSRLEPTILASLAEEHDATMAEPHDAGTPPSRPSPSMPSSSMPSSSMMDALADARVLETNTARDKDAAIIAGNQITLDWMGLAENGFLTPHNQNSLKAEEFRVIKRPLLRAAFGQDAIRSTAPGSGFGSVIGHVAMVTSPSPGDGKTFNAINLAISIAAERDLQVLLIDGDMRSRGLSRTLGIADRPGLMELLGNSQPSVQAVTLRTDLPSLSIIPAGQPGAGSAEMLASNAMTRLMQEIANRDPNRFIIFDAPPILASSEPAVLASHVGQVVMVVRANETSKRQLADALSQVTTCRTVNFVLNQISLAAGPNRYGYYGQYPAEAHG